MKQLIINADDFGMSREVNLGTKKGIQAGVVSSVSLMPNMPFFDEAVKFIKKVPNVSVGLHFNITEGAPLSSPRDVSSLVREDNYFYHWITLAPSILFKKVNKKEIETELRTQYAKLERTGLKITHIDSHHHIHLSPSVFKVVSEFASEKKVTSLRCHEFNLWNLFLGIWRRPIMTQCIVNGCILANNQVNKSVHYPHLINRFFDLNWAHNMSVKQFSKVLEHLPDGTTEFICHLAVMSLRGNKKFLQSREDVLKLLTNAKIRNQLLKNGISLVNRKGERLN